MATTMTNPKPKQIKKTHRAIKVENIYFLRFSLHASKIKD